MKRNLRLTAALLLIGSIVIWAAAGASRGWTETSVPMKIVDPVTGLEGVQWQKKFVPGVDFLGAALLGAVLLTAVSFFVPSRSKPSPIQIKS